VLARWLLDDYRRLLDQASVRRDETLVDPVIQKELDVLSEREQQVLELVAEGMTNSQIGDELGISPKTVARHRERIMNKLNLHSCTELVKFALRTGLIHL
jgi:RNA polymerase sigma factor (sigma-70 family)